ncbi:MAG: MFS transporter, partial [Gammaproteobacteria bacterium]|nr:MFS transporter [Gammaproteobacteria bacterium]
LVSWMRILGTAQWLFDETQSAAMVGVIGVVQLVVQIPALLWGGALADRIDRKRLMTFSNVVTAVTLLVLGVLNWQDSLTPTLVYVGIALTAGAQMLASPARSALVPIVMPKPLLLLAASTDTASQNAAAIAGPLLFAVIAVNAGLTEVFVVAGAIALVSSVLPLLVRAHGVADQEQGDGPPPSMLAQTKAGFQFVRTHPILPGLFLLDIGITTASFYREILPVLALGLFAGGASATGMLGAANSVGAIIGAFIALLFVGYRAKGMLVLYASFAYGVVLFGFGTANSLWMGMVMIACLGVADAVTVAVRQTTIMLTTPDHMRGRAFALMILAAQTANNVGTIWVGAWAGAIGAGNTMILAGVISITATVLIWRFWRPIREFRS